jgi:hypothetical protein
MIDLTRAGGRSPADPAFDPFWARVAEAGLTVLYHGGESYYSRHLAAAGRLHRGRLRCAPRPFHSYRSVAVRVCPVMWARNL